MLNLIKIMELIVDLHIHSHYSRATSKDMNLEGLYRWGKIKGIQIMGTGDFTHPAWFAELQDKLEPAEAGLFKLKDDIAREQDKKLPVSCRDQLIRFVPSVEISTIYSKNGKVRKLHNLIVAPGFETVSKINSELSRIGNLKADGRPILGMDSKDLLKLSLEADSNTLFIPAHIWTPWFSVFGSKSGFDHLEEAYEELTPYVRAVETGLSSDPYMNWRKKELQSVAILSNSDAHSPAKLGREASIVDSEVNYQHIIDAIKSNDKRMKGTIEFFPEEGKYQYDGHRVCKVRFSPQQTREHKGICPVCGNPLVIGVQYRVDEIADYPEGYRPKNGKSVEYIIPLAEIIAEIRQVKSVWSRKVVAEYEKMIVTLGNEFRILRNVSLQDIKSAGFPELSIAIDNMRKGKIHVDPGYDGVYGTVKVFSNQNQIKELSGQSALL